MSITRKTIAPSHRPAVGDPSPWGTIDAVAEVGTLTFVSTPSHGGFYVPAELAGKLDRYWHPAYVYWHPVYVYPVIHGGLWLEEDCEWAVAALAFLACFDGPSVAAAARMLLLNSGPAGREVALHYLEHSYNDASEL